MAEQYQIPRGGDIIPFQVPTGMAETAAIAGNEQAQEQETMNNFLRQWNAATNIDNANRAQSLREKQFAQTILENNRDYQLRSELQDSNLRNNDISFQIKQFAFDRDKENYAQLKEAWMKKEGWAESIDSFLPEGGNSGSYLDGKAKIFRMYAKNPADYAVLTEVFKPYDAQFSIYQANKTLEDEAKVQEAFDSGFLDGESINNMDAAAYFREAQMVRQADPAAYAGALRGLIRIANEKKDERKRQLEREQEAIDIGIYEGRRIEQGLPPAKMTYEKGQTKMEAATPRVIASRGTAGGGYDRAIKVLGERADQANERVSQLEEELLSMEEGPEKVLKQAELNDAKRQAVYYTQEAQAQAEALRKTTVPQQGTESQGQPSIQQRFPLPKAPEIKPKAQPSAPAPATPPTAVQPEKVANVEGSANKGISPEAETILAEKGVTIPKAQPKPQGPTGRRVRTQEDIAQEKVDSLRSELDKLSKQKLGRSGQPNIVAMQGVAEELAKETKNLENLRMLAQQKNKPKQGPEFAKTF